MTPAPTDRLLGRRTVDRLLLPALCIGLSVAVTTAAVAQDTTRVLHLNVRLGAESLTLSARIPAGWREVYRAPDYAAVSAPTLIRRYSAVGADDNGAPMVLAVFLMPPARSLDSLVRSFQSRFPRARLDARLRSLVWSQRDSSSDHYPIQHAGFRTDTRVGILTVAVGATSTYAAAARLVRDSVLQSVTELAAVTSSAPSTSPRTAALSPPTSASDREPSGQLDLIRRFANACREYDAQPNEIRKSEVFRRSRAIINEIGPIEQWTGILETISTNQGGSNATLVIRIGSSRFFDTDVPIGSSVYASARDMREGQRVRFTGRDLADNNLTERGKVCQPNFTIDLTWLR